MSRWFVLVMLVAASVPGMAQQAIDPAVFRALNAAQSAQQQGDHAAARKALEGVNAPGGSFEEALLWRSQAYVAWSAGNNAQAIDWLDKAVHSGKLDEAMLADERLNLARLNLGERRYARVVELLAPDQARASEEILQMLVQAYQGMNQPAKALPLAERYLQSNPNAADIWLQFLVGVNADLRRYTQAERWQRQLLARNQNDAKGWRQLAGLQQMAGSNDKALATLRAAYIKGMRFSEAELDNLVLLAGAADQPWQGAKLLAGLIDSGLLAATPARQERLGLFWWQARDRVAAVRVLRPLAERSGSGKHWLYVAQLELEQARWQAGLEALVRAERGGADRSQVRSWRQWAESELRFEQDDRVVSRD
ncbi:MAG TPA: hypothetical protein VGE28_05735 [Pseudomonas sp.]